MQIDYELIKVYGNSNGEITSATEEMNTLLQENYVEEKEVMEIALKYNVVILYEFSESTGYSEIILIDNKGNHIDGVTFSMDDIETFQTQNKGKSMSEIFEEDVLKKAIIHMREHKISEREFMEQYLDELYLDIYESKRETLKSKIKKYFVKK